MVIADTHKTYERLTSAGFSKEKAEALLAMADEGQEALATTADMEKLEHTLRADVDRLEQVLKAGIERLEQGREADKQETDAKMREMELRIKHDLMLRMGVMIFAAAGLQVVVVGILLALFQPG